jgi:23S rRNA (cytosine1962-C5)-methyltransferase
MDFKILTTEAETDYELIDSGEGEKLERYGEIVLARPDPQALWKKSLTKKEWNNAHATFKKAEGKNDDLSKNKNQVGWNEKKHIPEKWNINFGDLTFSIKLASFKHTGIFPEQKANWEWVREIIKKYHPQSANADLPPLKLRGGQGVIPKIKVLNLFGYTGGATLAAAQAGADVVHVDGSKVAMNAARENAELSGLQDRPIRWILDDALTFVKREVKRGSKYDGIIMDPPAFGRGPQGEVWKIEDHFLELLTACKEILSDKPLFFLINGYASGYSAISYKNTLEELMKEFAGRIEIGELTIEERSNRRLPAGIFARWNRIL